MTQRELAVMVKVGVPHISKIEAGRERPSDELIQKIAATLQGNADEWLLAARRLPPDLIDAFASDPKQALDFLRTWRSTED